MQPEQNTHIFTVSQLNRQAKELLETYLFKVQVIGEISNLSRPASGHWYFTLKDANAQVRCAMFRGRSQYVRFNPKEGDQVMITAAVSLYEARGDYQLIAEGMAPAGEGLLRQQFERLKNQLAAEGLFDPAWKKTLPAHPRHLGVVTSPTGAAIHDILTVLKRRYPGLPVSIYPVAVQGKEAAPQIARAINRANRDGLCDVLIVGRGGGSLEDLWPFNEEIVARAIFASEIPLISAVGHEVDFSISDMVADVRAATPSAAAELVSPDMRQWLQRFALTEKRLSSAMAQRISRQQMLLQQLHKRLRHPKDQLQNYMQRLDRVEMDLSAAIKRRLQQAGQRQQVLQQRLQQQRPDRKLALYQQRLQNLQQLLHKNMHQQLHDRQQAFSLQAQKLHLISPLNTLSRGYAIVQNAQGQAVRHLADAPPGTSVRARVQEGELVCLVTEHIAHSS
ncbi:MAG: exodeoxyribonuclease VII large subunit [Oceanospirillaceae bacterium]|nr:exodeoxyribonuclease VII large subunit [Oceanospirillaceae bacterium]MCP5335775.1 exodeoxyribonuclease VII large subunit [Oceanospirillaceae bacterium]MCP5349927.1 exodeoxyribonuclease VII large subunit [Oceanospirillaceae bacterium]